MEKLLEKLTRWLLGQPKKRVFTDMQIQRLKEFNDYPSSDQLKLIDFEIYFRRRATRGVR